MRSTGLFSQQLLAGARNCVLGAGGVKPGQKILILNLVDHLYWPTDELAVEILASVAQSAGAEVDVLWTLGGPNGMDSGYWDEVPRITLGAIQAADIVISNTKRIMRPQKAIRDAMFQRGVVWVRNMCTTAGQLSSEWARVPVMLTDEIYGRVGTILDSAKTWRVTHPNGTDISGKVGAVSKIGVGLKSHSTRQLKDQNYRVFPQGAHAPVTSEAANGVIILEWMLPAQAKFLRVPQVRFSTPLKVTVADNRMVEFEGGPEAEQFKRFYESLVPHLGDDAWNLSGWHAGINPKARLNESPAVFPEAWAEGPHNHPWGLHFHMGGSMTREYDYPYMWHVSSFIGERATVYIDDTKLYDGGQLSVLSDPEIRSLAAEYGDPDVLLSTVPLSG
jgi:2,5-dihydroxypyridine 5,6-dioxygenase